MKIQNTKDIKLDKATMLILGESGNGKTTLLGTLPGKTIIISMEKGLLSLQNKSVDYVEVEGDNVQQKVGWLRSVLGEIAKSDYDCVAIDSLTDIGECLVDYAKEEYPADAQTMKMWGYYSTLMNRFIKSCRDLNKTVIFTSLIKTTQDDIGRRFKLPAIAGSIAEKGLAHFDFVFNLMIVENDGEKKRVILTNSQDGMICKDRSGKLDTYERPDLGLIMGKISEAN